MAIPKENTAIKACAFCGDPLVFPYMDGGVIDRNRAKCRKCNKNVFVFGKTQYQIVSIEEHFKRRAERELEHGKL